MDELNADTLPKVRHGKRLWLLLLLFVMLGSYTAAEAQSPLTITTPSPWPSGTLNASYSLQLTVSGGAGCPCDWFVPSNSVPGPSQQVLH